MENPMVELEKLIKAQNGCLVRKKKHQVFKFPSGEVLVVSSTPSDFRTIQNTLSEAKRLLGIKPSKNKDKGSLEKKRGARKAGLKPSFPSFHALNDLSVKDWKEVLVEATAPKPPVQVYEPKIIHPQNHRPKMPTHQNPALEGFELKYRTQI